ncbi:SRPBCC family protein [uncultured Bacteroides sp.]|uniref:SRPBCC family protein n=1 Tax=uncultured Bacteroides sp. TaxID=162156 RepID=UPI002AA8D6C1|nr:SRPBCC family protein [uncultured Bacteroides sp.]
MNQFESSVKVIPYGQELVYAKLSDLTNLESMKDRIPVDKVKDLNFDADTLSFNVAPVGSITLKVIERDPCKCIKFETTQSPIPFNLWVQLVSSAENECKMKLTVRIDINPFMKGMIQKPLQEGLDKMADMLAMIQY